MMKKFSLSYPAKIKKTSDGYLVTFLDFDAFSEGDTLADALFNAREALDTTLLGLMDTEKTIPKPHHKNGNEIHNIPASPEVAVPISLYFLRKAEHKTISEIAKKMNVSLQRYHDIEKGRNITLSTLKRAAAAFGATVEISFIG